MRHHAGERLVDARRDRKGARERDNLLNEAEIEGLSVSQILEVTLTRTPGNINKSRMPGAYDGARASRNFLTINARPPTVIRTPRNFGR